MRGRVCYEGRAPTAYPAIYHRPSLSDVGERGITMAQTQKENYLPQKMADEFRTLAVRLSTDVNKSDDTRLRIGAYIEGLPKMFSAKAAIESLSHYFGDTYGLSQGNVSKWRTVFKLYVGEKGAARRKQVSAYSLDKLYNWRDLAAKKGADHVLDVYPNLADRPERQGGSDRTVISVLKTTKERMKGYAVQDESDDDLLVRLMNNWDAHHTPAEKAPRARPSKGSQAAQTAQA